MAWWPRATSGDAESAGSSGRALAAGATVIAGGRVVVEDLGLYVDGAIVRRGADTGATDTGPAPLPAGVATGRPRCGSRASRIAVDRSGLGQQPLGTSVDHGVLDPVGDGQPEQQAGRGQPALATQGIEPGAGGEVHAQGHHPQRGEPGALAEDGGSRPPELDGEGANAPRATAPTTKLRVRMPTAAPER